MLADLDVAFRCPHPALCCGLIVFALVNEVIHSALVNNKVELRHLLTKTLMIFVLYVFKQSDVQGNK